MTRVVRDVAKMRDLAAAERRRQRTVALVPTMGALHDGHLALLAEGRRRGEILVLSIFVNPMQFGAGEDLDRYPRDLEGDTAKARAAGVDVVFVPDAASVYPRGFQTHVRVRDLERPLCGAGRPGHFEGVATVVLKFLHMVRPDVAIFGEKDWQQLQVVRRMVRDLDVGVEIVAVPTVREADGLALSSRNAYLSADERHRALAIPRGLDEAKRRYLDGERDVGRLTEAVAAWLRQQGLHIDYVEARDAETLEEIPRVERRAVIAVAAFVGKTRLIDNLVVG